ncbi:MAG TPA: fused MFS/spermidine synthase [Bryobacteraceae bacterium]|nr:fused MFS/spermidine synthase [Bryobacteraceae bacterium]
MAQAPLPEGFFYGLTITASSALLFLVQPMIGKAILPSFGGSAGVWVTCMLFFQVALLLGYLYAHWITRLSRAAQISIHMGLLALSLLALPLRPFLYQPFITSVNPALGILVVLSTSVGLPYFLLSTTSPLIQSWYAAGGATFPYRLFAVSNIASLAALFAYPVAVEPLFSGLHQLIGWSGAYLAVAILLAVTALRRATRVSPEPAVDFVGSDPHPILWVALAACASALWLAVANHLSQEVAPIPFLWVLPLGIYLLSFILCFQGGDWYRPSLYRWLLPAAWIAVCLRIALQGSLGGLEWEIPTFAVALFVFCMFCHGELADSKPDPRQGVSYFYLMVALGGAVGAAFVGLIAPTVFNSYLELPIAVTGSVLLALHLLFGFSPKRLVRLTLFAVLAFVFALQYRSGDFEIRRIRNFYGVLAVRDRPAGQITARALYSGVTLHGLEFLSPGRSRQGTVYYGPESGVARVLALRGTASRRVGIIGLGAGTLAVYGRSGDEFRFYEINPAVIDVARNDFQFLAQSEAQITTILGDGRLSLNREPDRFDVMVLDAFSDDTIPVHLLTREAIETYFRHLRNGGILAVHITNRYLDLEPVLEAQASSLSKQAIFIANSQDEARGVEAADWALLSDGGLTEFAQYSHAPTQRVLRPWTDDFSNLFRAIR